MSVNSAAYEQQHPDQRYGLQTFCNRIAVVSAELYNGRSSCSHGSDDWRRHSTCNTAAAKHICKHESALDQVYLSAPENHTVRLAYIDVGSETS